jgi:hypothetical protein|tara:strand:- start:3544 stop:4443 length:900 start_codon:yes stop_codon:yes gene_type:complete
MFYVLSSHNIYALRRQFNTLSKNNTTVIINTLNNRFREQAESYCKEEDLRYFITESDGTAATGKNSFLDQFDKDDVPHAVLVDGDDYLTPRGVHCYQRMMGKKDSPDALILVNQVSLMSPDDQSAERTQCEKRPHEDITHMPRHYCQGSAVLDWDLLVNGDLIADNVPDATEADVDMFRKYITLLRSGMGMDELSTRLVFMSRKVIPYRFKDLVVGEDTLQYLEVKDAFERGELVMVAHKESKEPTYIYDLRISGIAVKESGSIRGRGRLTWMARLLKELENLHGKNKLHNTRVPITEL